MEAYLLEWLNLLLRWAHFVVGIAWIGSSFYFVWLDSNLNQPPRDPENDAVAGDLWAVHGGGFYHAQKYHLAPDELPAPLHWFKWEAYTTWLTGFFLLVTMYYINADVYLLDAAVSTLSAGTAVAISVSLLLAGWIIYDLLCRSGTGDRTIAITGFVLLIALSYGVSLLFSGRGAYVQVGAMLGTIMAANVFFVIIPGQRELVEAKKRGVEPDPEPGLRGKQRSIHNNYMTLPVLFVMLSPHYPMTWGHQYNWVILVVIFIAGVLIRHFFNLRNQGRVVIALPVIAVLIIILLAFIVAPRTTAVADNSKSTRLALLPEDMAFTNLNRVFVQRCNTCHSARPDHPTAPVAPNGVMFDTAEQIQRWADRIYERTVATRTMPLANLTGMTEAERQLIERWYNNGAVIE